MFPAMADKHWRSTQQPHRGYAPLGRGSLVPPGLAPATRRYHGTVWREGPTMKKHGEKASGISARLLISRTDAVERLSLSPSTAS